MENSKEIDTPIATTTKLDIDEPGSFVDQKLYRGMIGSLLYLTASRPGIVFSVGLYARFQENPKESHLTTIKRILRYLKGTIDLCLLYPKGSNFNLVGYADADYASFLVDRKSTSESGAKDAEIERLKKRLPEAETKRAALRTELAREKEKNDGIL
ncbi:secreted RxLR effector protein 161-like [Nicotiana tomentosiformis]|uniref:secreted RxLR effector protein 161-like n=1 Tax=Nicotiana tomentosiformis TaxID=4098 RepID=UPI00388CA92D